jgi:DNA polymerase-4
MNRFAVHLHISGVVNRERRRFLQTLNGRFLGLAPISYMTPQNRSKSDPNYHQELFQKVLLVFNNQPEHKVIAKLGVSCYHLCPASAMQQSLFDTAEQKRRNVSDAVDEMNDRYGEYVVTPALMMGLDKEIVDRIAFGGVKELADLYQ